MPLHMLLLLAVTSQPTAELHAAAIAAMIGTLLPLLTGVIVKKYADRAWAALVTLLLSVITGSLSALTQSGTHIDWVGWVFSIVSAYVAAIVAYYGIHVPTGLAGTVQNATASFGLGSVVSEPLNMTSAPRVEQLGVTLKGGRATPTPAPVPRVDPPAASGPTLQSGQPR